MPYPETGCKVRCRDRGRDRGRIRAEAMSQESKVGAKMQGEDKA